MVPWKTLHCELSTADWGWGYKVYVKGSGDCSTELSSLLAKHSRVLSKLVLSKTVFTLTESAPHQTSGWDIRQYILLNVGPVAHTEGGTVARSQISRILLLLIAHSVSFSERKPVRIENICAMGTKSKNRHVSSVFRASFSRCLKPALVWIS